MWSSEYVDLVSMWLVCGRCVVIMWLVTTMVMLNKLICYPYVVGIIRQKLSCPLLFQAAVQGTGTSVFPAGG